MLTTRKNICRSAAVANTQQFRFKDLAASAEMNCRGCRFLRALVEGAYKAFPDLKKEDSLLKWAGSRYTLEVKRGDTHSRTLQFFHPKGQLAIFISVVLSPWRRLECTEYKNSRVGSWETLRALTETCRSEFEDFRHAPLERLDWRHQLGHIFQ